MKMSLKEKFLISSLHAQAMPKVNFNKQVSKSLNDELNRYHSKVRQRGKPRTPMIESTMHLSERLASEPYQDVLTEIKLDHTGQHLVICDHTKGFSHHYTKEISQPLDDPNLITIESIEAKIKKDIEALLQGNMKKPDEPKWFHSEMGININGSNGLFLEMGAPRPHDFIPCLLTSQEIVLCADAVLGLAGSYDLGGRALMHINTKYARIGKRLREKNV